MKHLAVVAALAACDGSSPEPVMGLVSPSLMAAVADDGINDRVALQALLDAQCGVRLGPGVYDLSTPLPRLPAQRYSALQLKKGCSLCGSGPATVLRYSGDAGNTDWRAIDVVGNDVRICDLAIETSGLWNTEEQTHAVHVRGLDRPAGTPDDPAMHVTIDNVWFFHPSRGGVGRRLPLFAATASDDLLWSAGHGMANGWGPLRITGASGGQLPAGLLPQVNYWVIVVDPDHFRLAASAEEAAAGIHADVLADGAGIGVPMGGGDCVKIVSYDTQPSSVHVTNSHFVQCDRSGVSSVGGFRGLDVSHNSFYWTGDQHVDIEANNPGYEATISNNRFLGGGGGPFDVSLMAPRLDRVVFSGNILTHRGLFVYSARQAIISNNIIVCTKGGDKCVEMIKANDEVIVEGNLIVRAASAIPNSVISVLHHSTGMPGQLKFSHNVVRNETANSTVLNSGARRLKAIGNTFEWRPPAGAPIPTTSTLVAAQGALQRVEAFSMIGNDFVGPASTAVQLRVNAADLGIKRVTLTGNTADGPTVGYTCQSPSTNPVTVVSSGNSWTAPATTSCAVSTGR